uniref:Uncharacterized protein n=1 Tax=Anopheles braziliensis TaxID=58242 RepID=A0A2M3ZHJ5_9DIPT
MPFMAAPIPPIPGLPSTEAPKPAAAAAALWGETDVIPPMDVMPAIGFMLAYELVMGLMLPPPPPPPPPTTIPPLLLVLIALSG